MLLTPLIDWSSSFGRSFIYLIVLIFIIAAAYYATRFLTAKVRGTTFGNLKIMEGLGVGQHGSVLLVKAGAKYVLIGVTKDRITYLTELTKDELNINESAPPVRFDTFLSGFMKNKNKPPRDGGDDEN